MLGQCWDESAGFDGGPSSGNFCGCPSLLLRLNEICRGWSDGKPLALGGHGSRWRTGLPLDHRTELGITTKSDDRAPVRSLERWLCGQRGGLDEEARQRRTLLRRRTLDWASSLTRFAEIG